jgi:hypothetical protein
LSVPARRLFVGLVLALAAAGCDNSHDSDDASDVELTEALLTANDVPSDWRAYELSDQEFSTCLPVTVEPVETTQAASFRPADGEASLANIVLRYEPDESEAGLDELARSFEECPAYASVEPVDFPRLGDESVVLETNGESGVILIAIIRNGDLVSLVSGFGVSRSEMEDAAQAVTDKLSQ